MRNLFILDNSFDINITSSYHLSLQLHSGGLTFAILNTVHMKFLAFKNIVFEEKLDGDALFQKLNVLLSTEGYLKRNYKLCRVFYTYPKASLIPAPLFDKAESALYSEFMGQSENGLIQLEKYIKEIDAYLVYSIPENIHNLAMNSLDSPIFFHQAIPMIENAMIATRNTQGNNRVYAHIHPNFMDIIVIQDRKLLLYNSFPYKTEKDLVFYILYLFDLFQLPSQHTILELAGFIDERTEFFLMLKKYIKDIVFQEFNRSFNYSYKFNELPQHHFSNLINLFRCE
ncbi:MAG: DUF3822 family protein [Bacteroidales bacterium]|nr:DUF3822 family protein [Bacteroidales bacterium]